MTRPTGNGDVHEVLPRLEKTMQLGVAVYDISYLNEHRFVTAGRDRTARIWDERANWEIVPRMYHEGTVDSVRYLGSGLLATKTFNVIRIWHSTHFTAEPNLDGAKQIVVNGRLLLLSNTNSLREVNGDENSTESEELPGSDLSGLSADGDVSRAHRVAVRVPTLRVGQRHSGHEPK